MPHLISETLWVFDEPHDLSPHDIGRALIEHWRFDPSCVRYAPVGFGSYHWVADGHDDGPTWFVTADRVTADRAGDDLARLRSTASATHELASQGLPFVVAGIEDPTGRLVVDVNNTWAMQVFPYLHGASTEFGQWHDPAERQQVAELLARLHRAEPPPSLPRWDSALPQREALAAACGDLENPWTGGAYAERTRVALAERRSAIEQRLARYDKLARAVEATSEHWVVSHGEPHGGNVIQADGRMHLVDWDTVRLAPAERDLVNAFDDGRTDVRDGDAVHAYAQARGPVQLNEQAIELFRLWWGLTEICLYTAHFRSRHGDGEDDRVSWRALNNYLQSLGSGDLDG